MFYLIAYDIRCDRLRLRAAKFCLRIGLRRAQRSVFMGWAPPARVAEMETELRPALGPADRWMRLIFEPNDPERLLFQGKTTDLAMLLAKKGVVRFF